MANNTRVSSKLLPAGRRNMAKRSSVAFATEFDPRDLTKISLNRDTIQALTLANAEVRLTISPGGTTAKLHSLADGTFLGGMEDLAKLLGIRNYVAKEKKQHASNELRDDALLLAQRAVQHQIGTDDPIEVKTLDNNFVVAMRNYKLIGDIVTKRLVVAKANRNEESGVYQALIISYLKRIEKAICQTTARLVAGEKEAGLFDHFLFEAGVPAHMKTKLTSASLQLDETTHLGRIVFPPDPSKGLALTLREWRDEAFCKKQGPALKRSSVLGALLRDDEVVITLSGLDEEIWGNAEDPRTQRVMKTRFHVIPVNDIKDVLQPLSRENSRGWALPTTNAERAGTALSAVAAVFLCAHSHLMRVAELIPDFYDRVFPVGTVVKPDGKVGTLPAQALRAIEGGAVSKLHDILMGKTDPKTLVSWIVRETKMIPGGTLAKMIGKVIDEVNADLVAVANKDDHVRVRPEFAGYTVRETTVPFSLSASPTVVELESLKVFLKDHFLTKSKEKKKQRNSAAASALAKETKSFLRMVAKQYSADLAESLEPYFRGFMTKELQIVGVKLAEGRFDEMEELSDAEDSDDDESEHSD